MPDGPGAPRQSDLKRAISTAYYALFHAIARNGADLLVGVDPERAETAWRQTYRALDHGSAKNACAGLRALSFPPALIRCGEAFVALQEARHQADYDPDYRTNTSEAGFFVTQSEDAIAGLDSADRKDRVAFAVRLLLRVR